MGTEYEISAALIKIVAILKFSLPIQLVNHFFERATQKIDVDKGDHLSNFEHRRVVDKKGLT